MSSADLTYQAAAREEQQHQLVFSGCATVWHELQVQAVNPRYYGQQGQSRKFAHAPKHRNSKLPRATATTARLHRPPLPFATAW